MIILPSKSDTPPPTEEQQQALQMAISKQSFKVVAYAGAGKTTTLKLIGNELKGRGTYVAFNKSIATEAKQKFGNNIDCRTFHSLAFRHVKREITDKIKFPKFSPQRLANDLNLVPVQVKRVINNSITYVTFSPERQARFVMSGLSNFCSTHANYPAPRHLVFPEWLSESEVLELQEHLYPALEKLWLQSIDPHHTGGIGHEIYLKLWALSNPVIPSDFILFDEAQDADPLMMGILTNQPSQVIYVGDAHQQIYEWRGAVNAMKRLPLPQSLLTQSFRFGEEIANVANVFLKALCEEVPLRGNPNVSSTLKKISENDKLDAILCRTNAQSVKRVLEGLRKGHKVAWQGDIERILRFCESAEQLQAGKSNYYSPELAYFNNWQEVQEYSETDEAGDLKVLVNLVDTYTTSVIKTAISSLSDPMSADYLITTAHKAKGLEWDNVQIDNDFLYRVNYDGVKIKPEELRLLYVACTRGKLNLDVTDIQDLITGLKTMGITQEVNKNLSFVIDPLLTKPSL